MITNKTKKRSEWPSSKVILLSFSSLALSLLVIPKLLSIYERNQIQKDQVFTVGSITRFEYVKRKVRGHYRADIQYWVDGKPFTTQARAFHKLTSQQRYSLVNQRLPVIYEKKDPANSIVLSNEERFGSFGLMLPDSLIWTRQYFY